jgi:endonuclease/exonuclease/phosphatase family metal-dependent hydrolase
MSLPNSFRVCSYNIHKGFSPVNRHFLLDDMREAIRSIDADFVFLQEVMGENKNRSDKSSSNQFEFLADSLWPHYAYGRNAVYDTGHHGNAMLSKHSFLLFENYDVSRWSFSQRGVLLGQVSLGIYLACVHFGLFAVERKTQLNALHEILKRYVPDDAPLIIAGDFNDWTGRLNPLIKQKLDVKEAFSETHGRLARTFPGKLPLLPTDRIYYRNLRLESAEVLTGPLWSRLSDHCALTANFASA